MPASTRAHGLVRSMAWRSSFACAALSKRDDAPGCGAGAGCGAGGCLVKATPGVGANGATPSMGIGAIVRTGAMVGSGGGVARDGFSPVVDSRSRLRAAAASSNTRPAHSPSQRWHAVTILSGDQGCTPSVWEPLRQMSVGSFERHRAATSKSPRPFTSTKRRLHCSWTAETPLSSSELAIAPPGMQAAVRAASSTTLLVIAGGEKEQKKRREVNTAA
mmetsp:Transcript_17362/g.47941  ORF Transcript_17362/g.47941 Transcript_17362/m.47941 type:complete len:218 (+) Transcript_17362:2627-3280(+)